MWSSARIYLAVPSSSRGNEGGLQRGGSVCEIVGTELMDLNKINQMLIRFRSAATSAPFRSGNAEIDQIYFKEKLEAVLFYAGSEWGKPPTVEEFLSALDAAGFKIVEK